MKIENASDLEFMQELREATQDKLNMLLHFQACEPWRAMAISREINRRQTGTRQERQEKANDTANESRNR